MITKGSKGKNKDENYPFFHVLVGLIIYGLIFQLFAQVELKKFIKSGQVTMNIKKVLP